MVGLGVLLEAQSSSSSSSHTITNKAINPQLQVINKATILSSSSSMAASQPPLPTSFLDRCFLCKATLLSGKDIYIYKGDEAFCSVECRDKKIFSDEAEEAMMMRKHNYSSCTSKPPNSSSSSAAAVTSSPSSVSPSVHRKGARNAGAAGGIAY